MDDIDHKALALRVAAKVCHKDQMVVWSGEVAEALQDFISDDLDYSDIVSLHSAIERELRDIVKCALEHPETERALAAFLREAVSPWNFDMDAAPKDGTDLDLFDGIGVVQGAFTWPQSLEEWWETVGEEDEVPDTEGYQEYLEGEMFGWIGCETLSTDVLYLSPIAWRHRPSPPVLPTPPAAGSGE